MKKIGLLIVILFSLSTLVSRGQTNAMEGELDKVQVALLGPNNKLEKVNLTVDNRATDFYDGPGPAAPAEGQNLGTPYMFSGYTFLKDSDTPAYLAKEARPYGDKYYVDFPLYMNLTTVGNYTISCPIFVASNKAAVFVRLIDNENPDKFINLLDASYTFSIGTGKTGIYDSRFVVRIYAACLFKKDAANTNWNDANNWIGGVPGVDSSVKINNCAVIPEGAEVVISSNYSIGSLLNSGVVTISKNASLEILNEAKMISVEDIY